MRSPVPKSDDVLYEVSKLFWKADDPEESNMSVLEKHPEFLKMYAVSRAFTYEPSHFFHRVEEHVGSLVPFKDGILTSLRTFTDKHADASRDMRTKYALSGTNIAPLLLRLCEQTATPDHEPTHQRCLDAWDHLLEKRVSLAGELAKDLDNR